MNGPTKLAVAGLVMGAAASLPMLFGRTAQEPRREPVRVVRVQIDRLQLVPHGVGKTCAPALTNAACKARGGR